jgi:hypothetical protein
MHFPHIHSTLLRLLLRYSLNLILSFLFASANRTQTERRSVEKNSVARSKHVKIRQSQS